MRIKLILINHQVENQSNFLISIPFSIQNFGDFNQYLKQYFDLPESAHLQFQLDGFCILHKESIHTILKELDTLKVTLANQETLLQKRKGSTLSSSSVKKLKKEQFNENKFTEFINDMLQIQKNIELEQNKDSDEDSSSSNDFNELQEKQIQGNKKPNQQQQQISKHQRVVNSIKDDKSKELFQKLNSFTRNLSKAKVLKSSSESSSSSDSSGESESEIENVRKGGNKTQGNISAKYQKVLEKEACSTKQQVDKNNQSKLKNPIQATFQKGETFMKPNETLNAQTKVIQSKNQQQQLVTQSIKQAVDSQGAQNLYAKSQQIQQVQIKQAQAPYLNSNQTTNKQESQAQNTNKIIDLQKQNTNLTQKHHNATNKVAEKPTLEGVLNQKTVRKVSSSDSSSSSSSSDDDSEPQFTQKQQKIQLSFQKQNEQSMKPANNVAKQQEQQKNSNKISTPLSKQNQQSEEKPQSASTTPSSKPTLQPLLKGPKQEHVLNLNLKSPLEIYEEKKILWKQISPFITKIDKKLKKLQEQQAQKPQKIVNENVTNSQRDQHNQQKHNEVLQKIEAKHQNQQIEIQKNDKDQDLPPFDLKGFDKINLKDIIDYEKCLQKNFFNENDQIYFKDVELDEEKQCPILSEWKRGTVTQIINVKKVKVSVSIGGRMESSTFDTSVFKALYLKTSAEQAQEKKEQVQQIQEETKKEDDIKQEQTQQNTYRALNDKNIFVGRTVNYYYSDKNYYQDKYILEHSNRNQDHYMSLSLLLNFPKIKKEVSTIEDLVQKLQTFMKITNQVIQFELNGDKTMIRKKQLKKELSKDKHFQKQNNQNNNKNQNQKQNNSDSNKNYHKNNANKNGSNVPKLSQSLINQIHNNHKDQPSSYINNNNLKNELSESQQLDKIQQKQEKIAQKESEEGELDEKMEIESSQQNKENEASKITQMEEEEEEEKVQKTITQQIVQNVEQQIIKQINELSKQNH
ncbi:hypothetical protein ABPG72_021476 [Tetrahymena utriculariae]